MFDLGGDVFRHRDLFFDARSPRRGGAGGRSPRASRASTRRPRRRARSSRPATYGSSRADRCSTGFKLSGSAKGADGGARAAAARAWTTRGDHRGHLHVRVLQEAPDHAGTVRALARAAARAHAAARSRGRRHEGGPTERQRQRRRRHQRSKTEGRQSDLAIRTALRRACRHAPHSSRARSALADPARARPLLGRALRAPRPYGPSGVRFSGTFTSEGRS